MAWGQGYKITSRDLPISPIHTLLHCAQARGLHNSASFFFTRSLVLVDFTLIRDNIRVFCNLKFDLIFRLLNFSLTPLMYGRNCSFLLSCSCVSPGRCDCDYFLGVCLKAYLQSCVSVTHSQQNTQLDGYAQFFHATSKCFALIWIFGWRLVLNW